MVKNDISKKINESAADYEKVQSLQSARWLLPIIIRQFTADDKFGLCIRSISGRIR